jgi:hypothetical protein
MQFHLCDRLYLRYEFRQMPVSVALSMLTPASLIKERPLPPHSRLFEVSHLHVRDDEQFSCIAESNTNLPAHNFDFRLTNH